jgi:protein TonB
MSTCATAEQLLKDAYPRILRMALLGAMLVHIVAFVAVPNLDFAPYRLEQEGPPPLRPLNIAIEPPKLTEEVRKPPPVREFEPSEEADAEAAIDATVPDLEDLLAPVFEERARPEPLTSFEVPPVLRRRVDPVYPALARQAELEGTVGLLIVVDGSGSVESAEVVSSIPGLDEAAVAAVLQWEFEPARQRDVPVRVRIFQTVRFQLRG